MVTNDRMAPAPAAARAAGTQFLCAGLLLVSVAAGLPIGAIVAAVHFFLLIIIPFNQAYRLSVRGAVTLSTSQAVAGAPAIASQVVATDISTTVFGESVSFLAQRIRTIDSPAIIMQRTPSEIPTRTRPICWSLRWPMSSPGSCGLASPS